VVRDPAPLPVSCSHVVVGTLPPVSVTKVPPGARGNATNPSNSTGLVKLSPLTTTTSGEHHHHKGGQTSTSSGGNTNSTGH
jgi:hypothetical protein